MSGGQIVGWGAIVLGAGGAGGIITAKITSRSAERVASRSKPHELTQAAALATEAETHAFSAFMAEARAELDRLKAKADAGEVRLAHVEADRDQLAAALRECEEKHVESAVERDALRNEIHELRRLLDELRTQTGNDPQE